MPSPYTKPWKSLDEQLEILRARGMAIHDADGARALLARTNYYRLSGYWWPYRQRDLTDPTMKRRYSNLYPGTEFKTVIAMYDFDSALRSHIFEGIEIIEVKLRASVGYHLGSRHPMGHRYPAYLDPSFAGHRNFLAELDKETTRSREDFVRHIRDDLDQHLPVWAATELMTFGQLKDLALGLLAVDRQSVAKDLGLVNAGGQTLSSTLRPVLESIRVIRNVCGHHGRLWNKTITAQMPDAVRTIPSIQHIGEGSVPKHFTYEVFAVLSHLVQSASDGQDWNVRLRRLLESIPNPHGPSEIGCPQGWAQQPLWN